MHTLRARVQTLEAEVVDLQAFKRGATRTINEQRAYTARLNDILAARLRVDLALVTIEKAVLQLHHSMRAQSAPRYAAAHAPRASAEARPFLFPFRPPFHVLKS